MRFSTIYQACNRLAERGSPPNKVAAPDQTYRGLRSNVPSDYVIAYNYVATHHWANRFGV